MERALDRVAVEFSPPLRCKPPLPCIICNHHSLYNPGPPNLPNSLYACALSASSGGTHVLMANRREADESDELLLELDVFLSHELDGQL